MAKDEHSDLISVKAVDDTKGITYRDLTLAQPHPEPFNLAMPDDNSYGHQTMRQRSKALENYEASLVAPWYPEPGQHFMMRFRNGDGSWREDLFLCDAVEPHCVVGSFVTGSSMWRDDTKVFIRDDVVFFPVSSGTVKIMVDAQVRKDAQREEIKRAQQKIDSPHDF